MTRVTSTVSKKDSIFLEKRKKMGCILILLLSMLSVMVVAETSSPAPPKETVITIEESTVTPNVTSRKGKHIHVDRIEIPMSNTKVETHIIKIPSDVSKVKLIRPIPYEPSIRDFEANRRMYTGYQNSPRPNRNRNPQLNRYEFHDDNRHIIDNNKVKRNLQKHNKGKENNNELIHNIENLGGGHFGKHEWIKNGKQNPKKVTKNKWKQQEYQNNNQNNNFKQNSQPVKLLNENNANKIVKPQFTENKFELYESSVPVVQMQQVPAPNLFTFQALTPANIIKQSQTIEQPLLVHHNDRYISALALKNMASRGQQPLLTQHYTTHNPHVLTNFGLSNMNNYQYFPKVTYAQSTPLTFPSTVGKFIQPSMAASEQVVTTIPAVTPGIQVIQAPQFRDVTTIQPSYPSRLISSAPQTQPQNNSQRATIREILEQDCPAYDVLGYCESPPRYPMVQIRSIIKKCSGLMEAMNTANPDPTRVGGPHQHGFAKRYDEEENRTDSFDFETVQELAQRRMSNDGITACASEVNLLEPGYAREVTTGRWFVIVQHPETVDQKITTDACKNPGQPCGGLSSIKCASSLAFKSTKCVQRYSYQRLISWDPDAPDSCPKMRIFKFPSACVCHLDIV